MKKSELIQKRGEILGKFTQIDFAISMIISQHYLEGKNENLRGDFVLNFLGNELCTFGLKRNILKHIVDSEEWKEIQNNFYKISDIRNLFAHGLVMTKEEPDRDPDIWFSNPKNPKKTQDISPDKSYNNFLEIYPVVMNWLVRIAKKKDLKENRIIIS